MSDKYIIYDSKRKEYVTKEGRTAISHGLVYETSKDENNSLILDYKVAGYNLAALETALDYPTGTLKLMPASKKVIAAEYNRKQLLLINTAIENIAMNSRDSVRDNVEQILGHVTAALYNNFYFDLEEIITEGSISMSLDDVYVDEDDEEN
ncbi:hypothetical protein [Loigolactobacillus zhaoyuanensis]|uniref:hypothetical protein n=1 Tax=Loigolactobacillus zhaoyuanensis TaxID=2486017 RepID=UPI000F74042B|nr:hypothetical protein [Loigolactobacillus zhaoyuanensis]